MKLKLKLSCLLLFLGMHPVNAQDKILNIYAWAGYLPESVVQAFEQETGIRIRQSTYVNNEVLYAKLIANPKAGYDIVMPSAYFVSRMVKQGLLQKIEISKLKNFKYLNSIFLNQKHDPKNEYSIPYLWSATGIAVNVKYHPNNRIAAWKDLWNIEFNDQLLMLDDAREAFSVALLTLGYSVNDRNPEHIKEAFLKLKSLMSNIRLFNLDAQRSIYLDEDITVGMGWTGDIYLAKQENPQLQFIYPKEGAILSLDCIAIPKGAKHLEYVYRFIDFILQPKIAKKISLETGFSTPNEAAQSLLPKSIRENPILYPHTDVVKQGHLLMEVGEAAPLYEKYFELLKLEH